MNLVELWRTEKDPALTEILRPGHCPRGPGLILCTKGPVSLPLRGPHLLACGPGLPQSLSMMVRDPRLG